MNNLSNIVVYIKDETMLEEAREMLIKYGEKISRGCFCVTESEYLNYLKLQNMDLGWYLGVKEDITEITLTELEQLLKQNRDVQ